MDENELPEWYTVIKNCLREYECFDMEMFAQNGGPAAYAVLEMKFRQEKTLLNLSNLRIRNADESDHADPGGLKDPAVANPFLCPHCFGFTGHFDGCPVVGDVPPAS